MSENKSVPSNPEAGLVSSDRGGGAPASAAPVNPTADARGAGVSGDAALPSQFEARVKEKEARIAVLEKELAVAIERVSVAETAVADRSKEADVLKRDLAAVMERLKTAETTAVDRTKESDALKSDLTAAVEHLKTAEAAVKERSQESDALKSDLAASRSAYRAAIGKYLTLVQLANPEVPAEMIAGETVEQVEEALARAHRLVARVREALKAGADARIMTPPAGQRVPPGAPGRTGPDLAGLSPREKIQLGVRKQ